MINDAIREGLTRQVNTEFQAAYNYLGMSTWCERRSYLGSAQWLRQQNAEELGHGMRLYRFLLARDCDVRLETIQAPAGDYASLLELFTKALEQEQDVSRRIDELYQTTFEQKAYATLVELQWFLTEQVEEEKTVREIVKQLQLIADDQSAILEIDRELRNRNDAAA